MNLITKLLLAGLATAAHAAHAADPAAPAQAASAAAANTVASSTGNAGAGKMVCTNEPVTGSRFPRRLCYTQADWQKIKDAAVETTREFQGRPTGPVEEGG